MFDDEHFWIVAKYLERNSIKANITNKIEGYKHQSLFQYLYKQKHFNLLENSQILNMSITDYHSFINSEMNDECFQKVYTEPKTIEDKEKQQLL